VGFSPDGRTVAAANHLGNWVKLYEVATGKEQASLEYATTYPQVLAFSPDGRLLAINTEKGVKLLNLPLLVGGVERVPPASLPALWDDLVSDDAARAYRSRCRLLLAGPETVQFLQQKLRPVREPPADRLVRLLKDLESKRYLVRKVAAQELEKFGEGVGPSLQKALERNPPLDLLRRIESLLANLTDPRQDVAVGILESIGDRSARRLLAELASGLPGAHLTREATRACDRLSKRNSGP
jgi:hypothetical protein